MLLLHGSGKTAVLVERILYKVIEEKIDIDKMLIVTFTNAAASEIRERLLNAIYKKIEEEPQNRHLQKQITLLNKANICTIHSFCLDVIRNYFYELDIPANFRVGDSTEIELLKQEVIEDLFEEKYINNEEEFLNLVDLYANYRGDEDLKELILNIYNKIQSTPFPKDWLEEKVEMLNLKYKLELDFSKTIWGKIILEEIKEEIVENRLKLENILNNLKRYPELEKYMLTILKDKEQLEQLEYIFNEDNIWDKLYNKVQDIDFDKWPIDRKITNNYKDEVKKVRDKIRDNTKEITKKKMIFTSKEANEAIYEMYPILVSIKNLVLEFEEKFLDKKKQKNIIDFNDIEHFALKILVKKEENNKVKPTYIAEELSKKIEEIAIDEYQDSNLVQEYILNSVSRKNNIFMVGDIKQSIYRFREARPELFLEKYQKYDLITDRNKENGKKIKLFKNFRSRKEVLDFSNLVFSKIMSSKLGDIEYNEDEYLNLGAEYKEEKGNLPELHILDLKEEEKEDNQYEDLLDENLIIEKNEQEAKMVASRIEELFNKNYMVSTKDGKRKVEYRDIAILLRSTTNIAPIYEKELTSKGLPVFCDTSSKYIETSEIQTVLSLLKIIDNPMQDIPLVHILRSYIGNFSENELLEIRFADSKGCFYEAMLKKQVSADEELKKKIQNFLNMLENFRNLEKELPLNELIWKIYLDTNYYNYVGCLPNGNLKQANLKMLFERAKEYEKANFKGLYQFINFMNRLKYTNSDLSSAKIIGENDNVIRIMSIHKSKGLEFPIVFLSNTSKMFNKQDLNENILIHQDLGFGPKLIDKDYKIEYPTLAKEAIRLKLQTELISEEMRVLYVALTRAKEKLIMTGTCKDFEKEYKEKEEIISLYKNEDKEKIDERLLKKYTSYLDWLLLILLKEEKQDKIELYIHKLDENKKQVLKEEVIDKKKVELEEEKIEKLRQNLEWKYKYEISSKIPTKTSVTKLKEQMQEENNVIDLDELFNKEQKYNMKVPNFIKKEKENISSARKGTLIHLCLQKLDSKKEYTKEDLQNLIQSLVDKEIILQEEADVIPIIALENYLKSNLWNELRNAKEIHKEEPFYLELSANRINKAYPKEDSILLQGIIDLYYINKDDELVLVDYKTDYIKENEKEKLITRYKEQLDLYKEALEKSSNRKVDKVLIYSTWVNEIIVK